MARSHYSDHIAITTCKRSEIPEKTCRLPDGPKEVTININFTPRMLQFIDLRYNQYLGFKEIAEIMSVSVRTVKYFGTKLYNMLGVNREVGNEGPVTIMATKLLVKYGLIIPILLFMTSCTQSQATIKKSMPPQAAPLTIVTVSCPNGTVGVPYTCQLQASGGTPPYTWSISSGSLPAGLALDPTSGLISGTPIAPTTPAMNSPILVKNNENSNSLTARSTDPSSSFSINSSELNSAPSSGSVSERSTTFDNSSVDLHAGN